MLSGLQPIRDFQHCTTLGWFGGGPRCPRVLERQAPNGLDFFSRQAQQAVARSRRGSRSPARSLLPREKRRVIVGRCASSPRFGCMRSSFRLFRWEAAKELACHLFSPQLSSTAPPARAPLPCSSRCTAYLCPDLFIHPNPGLCYFLSRAPVHLAPDFFPSPFAIQLLPSSVHLVRPAILPLM